MQWIYYVYSRTKKRVIIRRNFNNDMEMQLKIKEGQNSEFKKK